MAHLVRELLAHHQLLWGLAPGVGPHRRATGALLIIRDLLTGPKRFSDSRRTAGAPTECFDVPLRGARGRRDRAAGVWSAGRAAAWRTPPHRLRQRARAADHAAGVLGRQGDGSDERRRPLQYRSVGVGVAPDRPAPSRPTSARGSTSSRSKASPCGHWSPRARSSRRPTPPTNQISASKPRLCAAGAEWRAEPRGSAQDRSPAECTAPSPRPRGPLALFRFPSLSCKIPAGYGFVKPSIHL